MSTSSRSSYAAVLKCFRPGSNLDCSNVSLILSLFKMVVKVVLAIPNFCAICVLVVFFFLTAAKMSNFLDRVREDCLAAVAGNK